VADTRLRQLGLAIGGFPAGPTNSIVDVPGIRVGHTTVTDGHVTFSGATAIVADGACPATPLRAGLFVGNGYGKLVGATQVAELGQIETPVVLTSTLSAFLAADAIVTWMLGRYGAGIRSVNPVVGEINDSWLSCSGPRPVSAEHVLEAIGGASAEPVLTGNVGGGTGACALGFKGGIGSASRIVDLEGLAVTIGALVQVNMDGQLRAFGRTVLPGDWDLPVSGPAPAAGSCVIVLGVDAPVGSGTLRRIAARAVFALARVGARFSHGSGDYALAVSTSRTGGTLNLTAAALSAAFEATMDMVEEAILDALLSATTVRSGNGHIAAALPLASITGSPRP
jgi:D-aminopeptidase